MLADLFFTYDSEYVISEIIELRINLTKNSGLQKKNDVTFQS